MSRSRLTAIIIVALLHALLGYAFVTGLAYNVVKKVAKDLKTFDVTEEAPPPEEEPPPPPPKEVVEPPPVVTPPPIVRTQTVAAPPIVTTNVAPPPVITPTAPPAPPPPPPPPKPVQASPVKPRGSPGSWVSNDDYPASAIRAEESGTTGFRLDVGPDGRVTNCTVTSSSGSSNLDQTACKLLQRRARFTPAKDTGGNSIASSWSSQFRWVLPDD